MLVKILCSCGTKYSFDVEPVDGRMPAPVQCPNCALDGTEAANEYARQMLAASGSPVIRTVAPTAPPPPPAPVAPGPITPHVSGAAPSKTRAYGEPNIALGTLGAAGAALIGMLVWYGIIVATNYEIGIIAWAVGGLTGFGCRVLGGGYSQKLGIIAGACAFVAIVGGEFLATRSAFNGFVTKMMEGAYDEQLAYAVEASKLETDAQIKEFLAKHNSEEGETPLAADSVSDDEVKEFRQEELPKMKDFAKGKPSRAEFEREIRGNFNSAEMQGLILKESVSLWTILFLFLGVGSAYRLGVGETA